MMRTARPSISPVPTHFFPRLRHSTRAVEVRVISDGQEVDSFRVSNPRTLRAALRPVYAHLPKRGGVVRFRGIEDESLPLGIDRVRREVDLAGPESALSYLAA